MITTLTGSNSYLLQAELHRLVNEFVQKVGDFGLEKFDGEEHESSQIRSGLTSLPFLSPEKMVVIRSLGSQKELAEELPKLLEYIPDTTSVVIVEPKLDKRSVYAKFLKKETEYKEFNELDERELTSWITNTVKSQNGNISIAEANFLIQQIGPNQQMLASEIQKLLNYNLDITRQVIIDLVEPSPRSTIFQLLEAAFAGNTKQAMRLYNEQRQLKVEPQAIIAMLAWQLHVLALLKTAKDRSIDDIAREAKLNPFVVRKSQTLARSISYEKLKRLISDLRIIDLKSKSTALNVDDAVQVYITGLV